jgi:hypothetical protein
MNKGEYCLFDARAGVLSLEHNGADLHELDSEWIRFVLVASNSPKELCRYANNGEYGDNCVVGSSNSHIYWEWFSTGKWIIGK